MGAAARPAFIADGRKSGTPLLLGDVRIVAGHLCLDGKKRLHILPRAAPRRLHSWAQFHPSTSKNPLRSTACGSGDSGGWCRGAVAARRYGLANILRLVGAVDTCPCCPRKPRACALPAD